MVAPALKYKSNWTEKYTFVNHLSRPFVWESLRNLIFSRPNDDSWPSTWHFKIWTSRSWIIWSKKDTRRTPKDQQTVQATIKPLAWQLVALLVRNIPVESEGCKWIYERSYIWTAEKDVNLWLIDHRSYTSVVHQHGGPKIVLRSKTYFGFLGGK